MQMMMMKMMTMTTTMTMTMTKTMTMTMTMRKTMFQLWSNEELLSFTHDSTLTFADVSSYITMVIVKKMVILHYNGGDE